MKIKTVLSVVCFVLLTFGACKKDKKGDQVPNVEADSNLTLKQQIIGHYANMVYANYEDAYNKAVDLKTQINTFINSPNQINFNAAKAAWLLAREPYGQTECFRFYGGPIDDDNGPEGLINSWPMDEQVIDYVQGNASSGIINNVNSYPDIDEALLVSANQTANEESVTTGYHAIEFLLWGQDTLATSAGTRPFTDYISGVNGTASNQVRRGQYLKICADVLVKSLAEIKQEWLPNTSGNYHATFLALPINDALRKILVGIGVLSKNELAGERIFTAYNNQDQEDEHSCFSDNTHRDIITNQKGIDNVYNGSYTSVNGTIVKGASIKDLVKILNANRNTEMLQLVLEANTKTSNILNPFDQAIILPNERPKVLDTHLKLKEQGDKIKQIANDLGLSAINI